RRPGRAAPVRRRGVGPAPCAGGVSQPLPGGQGTRVTAVDGRRLAGPGNPRPGADLLRDALAPPAAAAERARGKPRCSLGGVAARTAGSVDRPDPSERTDRPRRGHAAGTAGGGRPPDGRDAAVAPAARPAGGGAARRERAAAA